MTPKASKDGVGGAGSAALSRGMDDTSASPYFMSRVCGRRCPFDATCWRTMPSSLAETTSLRAMPMSHSDVRSYQRSGKKLGIVCT